MKNKDLRKWLKNKSVRMWKRTLLLLYEEGGPLSTDEIAEVIEANKSSVYKVLRKLEVSYRVKSKKVNNRVTWTISDYGTGQIKNMQEKSLLPSRRPYRYIPIPYAVIVLIAIHTSCKIIYHFLL